MNKIEMAKASAREQTRSSVALAQAEAETQRQLRETLEHAALSVVTVTTRFSETMDSQTELVTQTTERVQTVMAQGVTALQAETSEVRAIAKQIAKTAKTSAAQTKEQIDRFRMTTLAMTFAAGLMAGVILLSFLLILQPQMIRIYWTAAQALAN